MRCAFLIAIGFAGSMGCKAKTTAHQELCAKAAAAFDRCESFDDLGSGSDAALTRELMLDRWRGLCRAVHTGETAQLMPNTRELFAAMDEETKAGLRVQAQCTAAATTCAEYAKCSE